MRCIIIITETYKTEADFEDKCSCAFDIYKFIDDLDSNVRWFFKKCYVLDNHNQYIVELTSYDTPDYKDFKTTITAIYNSETQQYEIKLIRKFEPF